MPSATVQIFSPDLAARISDLVRRHRGGCTGASDCAAQAHVDGCYAVATSPMQALAQVAAGHQDRVRGLGDLALLETLRTSTSDLQRSYTYPGRRGSLEATICAHQHPLEWSAPRPRTQPCRECELIGLTLRLAYFS